MFLPTFMTSEHPDSHVFLQTKTIFIHMQYIIKTNILTKFHEDSRSHIRKNAQLLGGHIFQENATIFELVQDIIGTNLLTMFHDDRTIIMASRVKNTTPPLRPYIIGTNRHDDRTMNVASRVLIMKNAPPPCGHVFNTTATIFEPIQDIIGTNLLTKFHEDRKINVASNVLTRKNAPPPGGHVFSTNRHHF
ncbi:hypothetical protein DPMN_108462 [Dreissena polymorpha]|uniref:Uncharacterized protein n=1 Tax=Dreissena polymorpha TaxID=45954 RepID=A0A9D4K8L3_DREPO|nr:hypothetical protein DPMN_108462 [Dreissena polymorpha]